MKKFSKAIAAIMLTLAVVIAAGCTKDPNNDDPNNGENGGNSGGGTPALTEEGIYLGIIGFNYNLYSKEISLLNNSTKGPFISFIDDLTMDNLTGLYFADYTALNKLQSYDEPPKLTNVALVTFTDGLDNASLDDDKNPENYPTREAYLNALNNKIKTETVQGLSINAYTIGLKGNDVQDVAAFQNNLKKLASSDDNVFEVTSMDEAIQRFAEIAESLHSTSVSTSLSLLVPPGYDDGLVLRFTFDQVGSATNPTLFLECTYKRSDNGRRLENISYHGFKQGVPSLSSVEKLPNGFYKFVFENLEKENGGFITQSDKEHLRLYRQISSGWEPETEFDNNNQSIVTEEQSSALIMLVLDCTTSLGSQFSSLKTAAKRFVETLVGSNNGGGGGGGNTQFYDISVSANPSNGGTVTGGGTYQQGNPCTVKATANNGYTFSNWTENGCQVSTNANYTFTVTGDRSLVANFNSSNPPTISVYQGDGYISDGDVLDMGAEYSFGFVAHSNIGLSSLTISYREDSSYGVFEDVWEEVDLSGLTSYTYVSDFSLGREIVGEISLTAVVSDIEGRTSSATIQFYVNQPDQPVVIEDWLYYGAWSDHLNCWGLTNGGDDEWAVMFPSSMLTQYNGTSITRLYAYIGEEGWYSLNIYKGGTSQPTSLLKTEDFYADCGWNSIIITPLLLQTSSSLWVSISCSYDAGMYPRGACEGVNNKNARWCKANGSAWHDAYETNGNVDICWEIQVFVTNDVKGEKGLEIQLPQLSNTQGQMKEVKSSQNSKEDKQKARPKK